MENSNDHVISPSNVGSSPKGTLGETGHEATEIGNPKHNLELQKDLVKQKENELKDVQNQIESFNQMLRQLSSQRELAIKRLTDMNSRITELTNLLDVEKKEVDAKDQELKSKRTQLQTLKNEEQELNSQYDKAKEQLELVTETISTTGERYTQTNDRLSELKSFLDRANTTMKDLERAIGSKDAITLLALCNQPLTLPIMEIDSVLMDRKSLENAGKSRIKSSGETPSYDPFAGEDPFQGDDPFAEDDPFKSDTNLALPEDDPFNPSSNANSAFSVSPIDPFAPPIRRDNIEGF